MEIMQAGIDVPAALDQLHVSLKKYECRIHLDEATSRWDKRQQAQREDVRESHALAWDGARILVKGYQDHTLALELKKVLRERIEVLQSESLGETALLEGLEKILREVDELLQKQK